MEPFDGTFNISQYRRLTNESATIVHKASIFSSRVDEKIIELRVTPISANTKIDICTYLDSVPVQTTEQIKSKCIKLSPFHSRFIRESKSSPKDFTCFNVQD